MCCLDDPNKTILDLAVITALKKKKQKKKKKKNYDV